MARLPVIVAQQPTVGVSGRARIDDNVLPVDPNRATKDLVEGARRASDALFNMAEAEKRVRDTIALGQLHAQATRELDDYRVELDKDPDYASKAKRFQERAEIVRKKYGDQFAGEAQARFVSSFDQTALAMENSVRHAARQDEVTQGRVALNTANEELLNKAATARSDNERDAILKQVDDNLQASVDSGILTAAQHKEARRQYLSKFEEALAQRQIRTAPGQAIADLGTDKFKYLDPVRREVLRTQAQGRLESLGAIARADARMDAQDLIAGLQHDVPPADFTQRVEQIRRVDPKLAARVEAEGRAAKTVADFRLRPLVEQAQAMKEFDDKAQNGGLTGEERNAYLRMRQAYGQELQRWTQDPFTAALQTSTAIRDAFDRASQTVEDPTAARTAIEASLEWQQRNGVPATSLAVVSRNQAKQLAAELATLDGAAFNQRLAQLQQQYGVHFDKLQRQLAQEGKGEAKLSALQTAVELPNTPQGQAARANLIDAGKINEADLKKLFPDDRELTKTKIAVEEALVPFRSSLGGSKDGMATMARYVEDATRLAAMFQQQGLKPGPAAERAVAQLVNDHYAFLPDNGGNVRVPRSIDGALVNPDAVRANMEQTRSSLAGADLLAPPDPTPGADAAKGADAFAGRIKQYSRWVTAQGGRSAVLVYEANGRLQPVLRKDGKPVTVDFTAPAPAGKAALPGEQQPMFGLPTP